jgi:hypothetical protein
MGVTFRIHTEESADFDMEAVTIYTLYLVEWMMSHSFYARFSGTIPISIEGITQQGFLYGGYCTAKGKIHVSVWCCHSWTRYACNLFHELVHWVQLRDNVIYDRKIREADAEADALRLLALLPEDLLKMIEEMQKINPKD